MALNPEFETEHIGGPQNGYLSPQKITFLKKGKTFFGNMSAPVQIHESKNLNALT